MPEQPDDMKATIMALRLHRLHKGNQITQLANIIDISSHEMLRFEEGYIKNAARNVEIIESLNSEYGYSGRDSMMAAANTFLLSADPLSIGKAIFLLREAREMSQQKLVVASGAKKNPLSSIEKGTPMSSEEYTQCLSLVVRYFGYEEPEQLVRKALGLAVHCHRESQGISPEKLAQQTGMDTAALRRFEETGEGIDNTVIFHLAAKLDFSSLPKMMEDAVNHLASSRISPSARRDIQEAKKQPIGAALTKLRLQRGWTEATLAHHLGTTQSAIATIEAGFFTFDNPLLDTIRKELGLSHIEDAITAAQELPSVPKGQQRRPDLRRDAKNYIRDHEASNPPSEMGKVYVLLENFFATPITDDKAERTITEWQQRAKLQDAEEYGLAAAALEHALRLKQQYAAANASRAKD